MPRLSFTTVNTSGFHTVIDAADAPRYRPELVKVWDIDFDEFSLDSELEVARNMATSGVFNAQGIGDEPLVESVRCRFIAQAVVTGPPIKTLPPTVVRVFAKVLMRGPNLSAADLSALLRPEPTEEEAAKAEAEKKQAEEATEY